MTDPRIHLTLDNCFAVKRWTRPADWSDVIASLGDIACIEASTDNELDPLFTTPEYLDDWADAAGAETRKRGQRIASLYSGHATYRSIGLTHDDERVREAVYRNWVLPVIGQAARVGAGLGFYLHAFTEPMLQDPDRYAKATDRLMSFLCRLATDAAEAGLPHVCYEQMYTPHQTPWTIVQSREYLSAVYERTGNPLYLTIDVGHQVGQQKFLRPTHNELEKIAKAVVDGERMEGVWLGSQAAWTAMDRLRDKSTTDIDGVLDEVEAAMDRTPYLFATRDDTCVYTWLSALGCYSPIVHLQQTNGLTSSHWPFTERYNNEGIIRPDELLEAIAQSYRAPEAEGMPPRCEDIYLTFELFAGTADIGRDVLERIRESIRYWRRFVPEDGVRLSELMQSMSS